MSKLNINKLRKDTIGCQHVLHFNNAGAALQPKPVIASIKHHIDLEASIGGYEAAEAVKHENELFYDLAARLINCSRDEIAYTNNATHAWNLAFYSLDFKVNGNCSYPYDAARQTGMRNFLPNTIDILFRG